MEKPSIKELLQRFEPKQAEPFVDEIIEHWPIYAHMRSFLIDVVNREIHRPKKER